MFTTENLRTKLINETKVLNLANLDLCDVNSKFISQI